MPSPLETGPESGPSPAEQLQHHVNVIADFVNTNTFDLPPDTEDEGQLMRERHVTFADGSTGTCVFTEIVDKETSNERELRRAATGQFDRLTMYEDGTFSFHRRTDFGFHEFAGLTLEEALANEHFMSTVATLVGAIDP